MRRYIESLDGIRGLAIILVLAYHYSRLMNNDASVLGFAWIGIQMFFVQSGYLITEILLEAKKKTFSSYTRSFYWRRFLRIIPAYAVYIGIFWFIYILTNKPDDFNQRLPFLLSFSYNFSRLIPDLNFNSIWFIHFWSLAVEEQFYLIWPLLVYFISLKHLQKLLVLTVLVTPLFRYFFALKLQAYYSPELTGEITYAFTLSQLDAFAIGAAIPIFNLKEKIKHPLKWSLVILGILLGVGAYNYSVISEYREDFSLSSFGISVAMIDNYQHVWSYTLCNLLFLFVILYLIRYEYKGFFNSSLLTRLGKVVYSLYIYHFAILYLFYKMNGIFIHNHFVSFILASITSYFIAYISYTYFESKFLKHKDLWD